LTRVAKYTTALLLVLLTSMFLTLALNQNLTGAYAQDEETIPPPAFPSFPPPENHGGVVVATSVGGTTDPVPGAYSFLNGTSFTIKATPYTGFRFLYWVISGQYMPGHNVPPTYVPPDVDPADYVYPFPSVSQVTYDSLVISENPLNVIHGYGYTFQYQAVFIPISSPSTTSGGIVAVLESVGGTSSPKPGTYIYSSDQIVELTATASSGFEFKYWVISGGPLPGHGNLENGTTTDNPLLTHAVSSETYNYQPVFTATGSTTPSGGIPNEYFYAAIIILAIVAVIAIAAALMYKKQVKK
jgi:hypothetical protein